MKIGIMSAMEEENNLFCGNLSNKSTSVVGDRTFTTGKWGNHDVVVVFSRWGKVAAAATATLLISKFEVESLIFTGVAGACSPDVKVGDIVVAKSLIQHDMDASPLCPRHQIPLTGVTQFQLSSTAIELAKKSAEEFLRGRDNTCDHEFAITSPKVHSGLIATGDKFFADKEQLIEMRNRIPDALCVEMEGAAVAQVCSELGGITCVIIRTISDNADGSAHVDFPKFVGKVASVYSIGILTLFLNSFDILQSE